MGCSGSSFGRVERVGSDTSLGRQLTREGAGARWIRTPDQGFESIGGSEQQPEKCKGMCISKACMMGSVSNSYQEILYTGKLEKVGWAMNHPKRLCWASMHSSGAGS